MYNNNHYIQQAYQKLWKLDDSDKRVIAINFKDLFESHKLIKLEKIQEKIHNQIITKQSEKLQLLRNTTKLFSTNEFIDNEWDKSYELFEKKGFDFLKEFINNLKINNTKVKSVDFYEIEPILKYFLLNFVRSKYFLIFLTKKVKTKNDFNNLRMMYQKNEIQYLEDFDFFVYSNDYLIKHTDKKDNSFLFNESNMIYKNFNKGISDILIRKYISLNEKVFEKYDNQTIENYYRFFLKNFILIILSPNHIIYGVKRNIFIPNEAYNKCANNIINSMILFDFYIYHFICLGDTFVLKRKRIPEFYDHLKNVFHKDIERGLELHNNIEKRFLEKIEIYKNLPEK